MRAAAGAIMAEVITREMEQLRHMIAQTVAKRESLKKEMNAWFEQNPCSRFERSGELMLTDSTLSQLDTHYKRLWDFHNNR